MSKIPILTTESLELGEKFLREGSSEQKTLGTHSGTFHADDALASALLLLLLKDSGKILRSRTDSLLSTVDFLYDVGGQYSHSSHRYDHHMKTFAETFSCDSKVKLSSAGLIFKHLGKEILRGYLTEFGVAPSEEQIQFLYEEVYKCLIASVDGADNGMGPFDYSGLAPEEKEKINENYQIRTDLGARIRRLNPGWSEDFDALVDSRFRRAIQVAGEEFEAHVLALGIDKWASIEIVEEAIKQRTEKEILVFKQGCNWKDHLLRKDLPEILFVISPNNKTSQFSVIGVPKSPGDFECRLYLHPQWRGLRGEELQRITGLSDAVFVHSSGFLGITESFESALKMAKLTIEYENSMKENN